MTIAFAVLALTLALAACGNDNGRLQGWVEADLIFVGPDEAGRVETLPCARAIRSRTARRCSRSMPICRWPTCTRPPRRSPKRARGLRASKLHSSARRRSRCWKRRSSAPRRCSLSRLPNWSGSSRCPRSGVAAQAQLDQRESEFQPGQGGTRGGAPADRGRASFGARGGHRGRAPDARGRAGAADLGPDPARAPQAVHPGQRRGAADLLPAGRGGAGGTAGGVAPAARQHQAALLRGGGAAAEDRARRRGRGHLRRLRAADRARELHLALGRIHAAGDLQPGRALQARVHDRGAHGKAGRPARRPAGAGRAQG